MGHIINRQYLPTDLLSLVVIMLDNYRLHKRVAAVIVGIQIMIGSILNGFIWKRIPRGIRTFAATGGDDLKAIEEVLQWKDIYD